MSYDVVIPTAGRPTLDRLLAALAVAHGPRPTRTIVVDDRPEASEPLAVPPGVEVLRGAARGPAAARNVGWRASQATWVAFLDDDVVPPYDWPAALARDLADLPPTVAASQGRITVPTAPGRRPTDWERNVRGLETARWATADMAFRRAALALVGGFDERFARAYREDADLALRLMDAGLVLVRGERGVTHPVGDAGPLTSLHLQAGNADDVLMDALHGPGWRGRADAPTGRFARHALTTAALAAAVLTPWRPLRRSLILAWAALTTELVRARVAPGPRTPTELGRMLITSVLMPPIAVAHRLRGRRRLRAALLRGGPVGEPGAMPPAAVLLDRDDTLIDDVPYNGDPDAVRPLPGARVALDRLRAAGCRLAVVSNQSGIGRGIVTEAQVRAVNARVAELLGPFEYMIFCPHLPEAGCECRKPQPGMVRRATEMLGVPPERCAMIGDIGADVGAAAAAGVRGILVPTEKTRAEEVAAARERTRTLGEAVDRLLGETDHEERRAA